MTNGLMDAAQLQQFVLRTLGAPFRQLPLSQDHLDDCVETARRWFSAKKGFKGTLWTSLTSGQSEYPIDSFPNGDQIDTILNVTFTTSGLDMAHLIDPLAILDGQIPANVFGAGLGGGGSWGGGRGLLSSYAQTVQYLKEARLILNAELDWVQRDRTLLVFPPLKSGTSGQMYMEYKTHKFTIEQLNERDHELVKRYTLAEAKERMGRILSQMDQYPTAQGFVGTDGPQLLEEARIDKEALTEELAQSSFPIGFLLG